MNATFIILSVIDFSAKELSYSKVRSIFSPEERLRQTLLTIDSVRKYAPFAKIVFIESGQSNFGQSIISAKVDNYNYVGNKKIIRFFCDGPYKGLGEFFTMHFARRIFLAFDSDLFIKLSGRYQLNNLFSLNRLSLFKFSFLKRGDTFSTRLFSFPRMLCRSYFFHLILALPCLFLGISIERALYLTIPFRRVHFLDVLGVEGIIGPTGDLIKE